MYKGLKPKLKKIVSQINVGDGIVLEINKDHYAGADRAIGYVKSIRSSGMTLLMKRETKGLADFLANRMGIFRPSFSDIKNIKIVDPVETK